MKNTHQVDGRHFSASDYEVGILERASHVTAQRFAFGDLPHLGCK